ncbi:unnamed protein product [Linum trigynum]|uniref:Uncharacterized protein n=1 Tax=Linum trigynum TaxID=586398 RepID=A0AAV2F3L9_9ROSI
MRTKRRVRNIILVGSTIGAGAMNWMDLARYWNMEIRSGLPNFQFLLSNASPSPPLLPSLSPRNVLAT